MSFGFQAVGSFLRVVSLRPLRLSAFEWKRSEQLQLPTATVESRVCVSEALGDHLDRRWRKG